MNMKRSIFFLLLLVSCTLHIMSQETMRITGRILDAKTRNDLPGSTVQLMTADSTVINSVVAEKHSFIDGREITTSTFHFEIPRKEAKYILCVSYLGYKTTYVDYNIGKLHKREFERTIPAIILRHDPKVLNEVNVVASKVKFYHKGDTVVYNADAFILSEGSMLDALIRQLPGVELKSDGRIYHNGKYVESLLLNGKEFFKGDNSKMLDLLPSYTVKQIKVYDKYGKTSEFLGEKLEQDKQYVMDVNLKKEYAIGLMANIEAGAGTEDKYLARLFAMRYTDHSRLTLYGNKNNLNDKRKPGQNDEWRPETMPRGESKEMQAGVDYNLTSRSRIYELNGNAQVTVGDNLLKSNVSRINFFQNGDTYDYERSMTKNKDISVSTLHKIDIMQKKVYLHFEPRFSYSDIDMHSNFSSLSSSSMAKGNLLDSILSGNEKEVQEGLINTYRKGGITDGMKLSAGLNAFANMKLNRSGDYIFVEGNISFDKRKEKRFNRYAIAYTDNQENDNNGYQFYKDYPNRKFNASLTAVYGYKLSKSTKLSLSYGFDHKASKHNSSLYRLDELEDFAKSEIGVLPSVAEYERTIDHSNSYLSDYTEDAHVIAPRIDYSKSNLWFGARLIIKPTKQRLCYERGAIDTTIVRKTVAVMTPAWILCLWNKEDNAHLQLQMSIDTKLPNLVNMVNMRDDSDPMNIRMGNSSLKNEMTYKWGLTASKTNSQKQQGLSLRLGYSITNNALAMGYFYNTSTGVRTYRADNVNGNWNGNASLNFNTALDKRRKWTFATKTSFAYTSSVDLIGKEQTNTLDMQKSKVYTLSLGETMKLDYKIGAASTIGAKADFTWRNVNSSQDNFCKIDAFDYSYGLVSTIKLPWHMQFASDLTIYGRHGYEGSSMNTNDFVWNARLSYTMLKGKLTWMLDAFDILNQLNNVTRFINAQGRTETVTNVLPRYALLHVAYRFEIKPKNKR